MGTTTKVKNDAEVKVKTKTVEERYNVGKWLFQKIKLIVNDSEWNVDLVMDYYGEQLGSERAAIMLMLEVGRLGGCKGLSYGNRLRELRQLLIDKFGFTCEDIVFTPSYRRRGH